MIKTALTTEVPIRPDRRPATLLDQARWLVETYPDATTIVFVSREGEHAITYRTFFHEAARYAYALEGAGVRPGDLVVLVLQHSEELLYGFWGAMLLGAIPSIFPFLPTSSTPNATSRVCAA